MRITRSATVFSLLFFAVAPNLHAARCSSALLKGTYAYSEVTPHQPCGICAIRPDRLDHI